MKIAVLFRGPIRPTQNSVIDRVKEFMGHFANITPDIQITTYLATWRTWKQYNASELLALDLFDNVIMQTPPTAEHWSRCTSLSNLPNGCNIEPVFKMYYQSKTALDLIINADNYDFIVHTRTDLQMILGQYINDWFDINYFVAPHIHPTSWMNDQFGIAPAHMMHKAWDYENMANFKRLIEIADKPEAILQTMIDEAGIKVRTAQYIAWNLDPMRNR